MRRAPWEIKFDPQSPLSDKQHPELDGVIIELVEPVEFDEIADGTMFYSIFGETKVKGVDEIDRDTRAGMMAWGLKRVNQNNRDLGVFEINGCN